MSNFKKSLRLAVITLLLLICALMNTACDDSKDFQDKGAQAVNSVLFDASQIERDLQNALCDEDNVLSNCP